MAEPITLSPLPTTKSPTNEVKSNLPEKTFDFPEAMKQVNLGKKVHKLEWKDREYYGFTYDDKSFGPCLCIHKPDDKIYYWVISNGDLGGTDYIVL